MNCPICESSKPHKWDSDRGRDFYLCPVCDLVFVPSKFHLSPEEEKERYESGECDDSDPKYREKHEQNVATTLPYLQEGQLGLDFGSGKSDLLARLYTEQGLRMDSHDIYFQYREEIWDKQYDFIVLSEVIQTLYHPLGTMSQLAFILRSHGQFFIKTLFRPVEASAFHEWFYKKDDTHVLFFNDKSLAKLASILELQGPEKIGPDIYRLWR